MISRYVTICALATLAASCSASGDAPHDGGAAGGGGGPDAGPDAPVEAEAGSAAACAVSADCAAWGAEHCAAPYVGICVGGAAPGGDAACLCNDWTACLAPPTCSTYRANCCHFFDTDAGKSACSGKCSADMQCIPVDECPTP